MARDAKHKMVSLFLEMDTYRALEQLAQEAGSSVEEAAERILFHVTDDDRHMHEQKGATA